MTIAHNNNNISKIDIKSLRIILNNYTNYTLEWDQVQIVIPKCLHNYTKNTPEFYIMVY